MLRVQAGQELGARGGHLCRGFRVSCRCGHIIISLKQCVPSLGGPSIWLRLRSRFRAIDFRGDIGSLRGYDRANTRAGTGRSAAPAGPNLRDLTRIRIAQGRIPGKSRDLKIGGIQCRGLLRARLTRKQHGFQRGLQFVKCGETLKPLGYSAVVTQYERPGLVEPIGDQADSPVSQGLGNLGLA